MLVAILAAGKASRFGGEKLSVPCFGKPLGQWSFEAARRFGHQIAWIGNSSRPSFINNDCTFISHTSTNHGLSKSVAIAAKAAESMGVSQLMILLADMPLVTVELLLELETAGPFSACTYYGGRAGVPALFPKKMYKALSTLRGDRGAAELLDNAPTLNLVRPKQSTLIDVDTPEDLIKAEFHLQQLAESPISI